MRQLALGWLLAIGCGSSMHRTTAPDDEIEIEDDDEPTRGDVRMPLEKVPAQVRVAAVAALQGATRISIVHTSSGQYEAEGVVDGEEQEVTISPSGAIIDTEEIDDIDLTDDDDGPRDLAPDDATDDAQDG